MFCPVCGHKDTKVNDSRTAVEGLTVRRRRECLACGFRFATIEQKEALSLAVLKKDGRVEPYSREKIQAGLKRALNKRICSDAQLNQLLVDIENELVKIKADPITSTQVGDAVLKKLLLFDKVAYIRFASVYRQFNDAESFYVALRALEY